MKKRVFSGVWEVCPTRDFGVPPDQLDGWVTMEVPSHWQQHPKLERWAGKVVYRKRFDMGPDRDLRYRLVLPGTFYWSTVYLNGVRLGSHEGYFNPQTYDVTDILRARNELVVQVDCPDEKAKNGKRMITGVFSHWDCLDPATNPGGLWLAPELHASRGAFIDRVRVHTLSADAHRARLRLRLDVTAASAESLRCLVVYEPSTFRGGPVTFEHPVDLSAGQTHFEFEHELLAPRLWWPHDLGKPDLYHLVVSLVRGQDEPVDQWSDHIGVRTIEVHDWRFYINGVSLYIKGNNYPPTDTRIATTTRARVDQDLSLAKECHFNMLRVHAHVGHPELYRAADRAGVLLWQDFPLQWCYRREVLPIARQQIADMVRLLYNHPSIALWCCHNEPIYIVDTKDEDLLSVSRTAFSIFGWSWNRDVMDVQLAEVARQEDPSRFVDWCSGHPSLRKKKGTDTHFYFGWYRSEGKRRYFDTVLRLTPHNARMISEFGAQSFPNLETCHKFMDPDVSRIDWAHLEARHSLQAALMDYWVGLDHPSLEALVQASQAYQVQLNRYYIDRIRRLKYRPSGGLLPFLFVDSNYAVQWSIVDYERVPKAGYYAMQKAFSPQYAFLLLDADTYRAGTTVSFPLFVVNDAPRRFERVVVRFSLHGPDGRSLLEKRFELALPADCVAIEVAELAMRCEQVGTHEARLYLEGEGLDLENRYAFEVASA